MESPGTDLQTTLAEVREELDPALRDAFDRFAQLLLRGVGRRQHAGPTALAAIARELFQLALRRKPGELLLRVRTPAERPGRTAIEILQDDRPFLVDSLRLFLERHDLEERMMLHPILEAQRDPEGVLVDLGPGERALPESLVYAEVVPALESGEPTARLERELRSLMETIRDVTDDYRRMVRVVRELSANVEFAGRVVEGGPERAAKICRFLDWLIEDRFVFLGVRRYGLRQRGDEPEVWLRPGQGLGLFRDDASSALREPVRGDAIPEELRVIVEDPRIVLIDKSRMESHIHRPGRIDRVIVKEHDESGRPSGFTIVFGLFTFRALRTPASQVPLLSERLDEILERERLPRGSHRFKAMVAAFDSAPVEFLLGSDVDAIAELIREIADAEGAHVARLVLRADRTGRSCYAAVLIPRDRYGEELRERIRAHLEARLGAGYVDDRVSFIEEGTAVLHVFCTASAGTLFLPDRDELEEEIQDLAARWEDRLTEALFERLGEERGSGLAARYETAFPESLRVSTAPEDAVRDVEALEALAETGEPQISLYFAQDDPSREHTILKLYLSEPRLLSELLPVVDHFGIRVVDAQQATVRPAGGSPAVVETFRVLPLGGSQEDLDAIAPRLAEALRAVLLERVADDALNGLVLGAGLDWRQTDCVRAYVEYFMQIQGTLTRPFLRGVLLENPLAVRMLVLLHEARFDPNLAPAERSEREAWLERAFEGYRDRIQALNEDRALAGLRGLVDATLRTTYFAPLEGPHRIAFKLDSSRVPELTGPRPYREIFVHSREMAGIHLRGGPVARGGVRWSDRSDDLRVEILDLMRTQMLKNGIIVPVGAKGGFVLRRPGLSPFEARRMADAQYRVFVASLLDLTDNVDAEGRVVPPRGVQRRDGDDPYLVVAADKGTAHLSDAANEIALARDFWLGDAFASGGSAGYDHKKYGITARGAWECVKHHFAELGIDPEAQPYTVAGIGDMSGDVFGNGMLLARRAKLVAAFDHRHVFLDPDPDPDVAWEERRRLFELPRSSWDDYDRTKLSDGGGVFPRSAKRIELSAPARRLLGIEQPAASGNEVVRAILRLPVDLLWNGGIGTYVKASQESHTDVGDRANDAVRIDARELRAKVVGEGGNLGLTQAARVEAARRGVRLDTDAIHNSGGVDLSDHEVNFKILLMPEVRAGRLSMDERTRLLFDVADEACERVLGHNRRQALALSLEERRSRADLESFERAIDVLCEPEDVDRAELRLPGARELARRAAAGEGLVRPELAVLLGLAKLHTRQAFARSDLVERAYFEPRLAAYFPSSFRERFAERIPGHRLARDITALEVTSALLDFAGVTLVPTLVDELGVPVPRAVCAAVLAEDVVGIQPRRERLLALAGELDREVVYRGLVEFDAGIRDVARFLIRSENDAPLRERVERLRNGLEELRQHAGEFLSEGEARRAAERRAQYLERGLPEDLAADLAAIPLADRGLNILRICDESGAEPLTAARLYAALGDRTGINWVYQRLPTVRPRDAWERVLLADLRWELLDLQRALTASLLREDGGDPQAALERWLAAHAPLLRRIRELRRRAPGGESLSPLVVLMERLRALRPEL